MADSDSTRVIISRKEAIAYGCKHYFTGKLCKRGHIAFRFVSTCTCCDCQYIRVREWFDKDHKRTRKLQNDWRKKNSEHVKKKYRASYAKNPDKFRKKTRKYYRANGATVREKRKAHHYKVYLNEDVRRVAAQKTKKWVEDNPERARFSRKVLTGRRRARQRAASGSFDAKDVAAIMKAQHSCCAYCRASLKLKYHVDHINPLAKGGSNDRRNLQILCGPCNLAKGARDPIVHAQSLGLLI